MKYQALESGTEFSMEIRMPTQNMHEISGTGSGHWILYGDKNTHSEYV